MECQLKSIRVLQVRSVKTQTTSQTNYNLLADLSAVQSATSSESIRMSVNAWPDASIEITAHHTLKLSTSTRSMSKVSTMEGVAESEAIKQLVDTLKGSYKRDTIIARPHQLNHAKSFKGDLMDRISLFRDQLGANQLATLKSSMAFVTLLEGFRIASAKEIFDALNSSVNRKIL